MNGEKSYFDDVEEAKSALPFIEEFTKLGFDTRVVSYYSASLWCMYQRFVFAGTHVMLVWRRSHGRGSSRGTAA